MTNLFILLTQVTLHFLKYSMKILAIVLVFCFLSFAFLSKADAFEFNQNPQKIIIPSLGITLPVTTVSIIDDTWDVSGTEASFGETTTVPGNQGNTVIFAHALPHLFETLPLVKKGAYVHVFTQKDWFVYKIYETKTVLPEDVSVLAHTKTSELTLYTCVGATYEKRFIVKAKLLSLISYGLQ